MTIEELRKSNSVIFECVSGSIAYGLASEGSDRDIKGIYIIPKELFYSLEYPDQVNEDNNNVSFYELRKFIELLSKNNPNMLELLNMPADSIISKDHIYDKIQSEIFLSKICKDSFAGYAMTQLKKARGLNKKILNPIDEKRKSILDFCYVQSGNGSIPLLDFLEKNKMNLNKCGLTAIPHMKDLLGLYYDENINYNGIVHDENSLDVTLSSIPKTERPVAIMSFNKDGYSIYCREFKEYWDWVNKRNDERYKNTISHGKNYDAKNIMHMIRLLEMAEEIGRTGQINVRRNNREELLKIKSGEYEYEEIIHRAEKKLNEIHEVYLSSTLPDKPEIAKVNRLLIDIRKEWYN